MSSESSSTEELFHVDGFEIDVGVARALARDGITRPTPVQSAGIPVVASGKHVVLQSGTGTGKTLAYLIPLLARAKGGERIAILAPAPELAAQVLRVVERVKPKDVSSASLIGSGNPARQVEKLRGQPSVVVGTPGRVLEMIARRKLRAAEIGALVLDEADRILSPENDASLRDLFSRPEFRAQLVIASATIGPQAEALFAERAGDEGLRIELGHEPLVASIRHFATVSPDDRKLALLAHLLGGSRRERVLVFVNRIESVLRTVGFLASRRIRAEGLSAARGKGERRDALSRFAAGEVDVLVATDAAARGLDVPGLDWVVHLEPARDSETYLHRSGRTGRAGREGAVLSILSPKEAFLARRYEEELGIEIEHWER